MRSVLFALLITSFFNFGTAFSQNLTADLSLSTIPTDPAPLSNVTVMVTSYSVDIDSANIEWKYNGKTVASGTGKKSIKVTAPANGAKGIVSVTASGYGLSATTTSIVISPGSVDLLWEAVDAYTPPFYKGKALLPYGGVVRVTAIPGASSPKSTTFNWTRNGTPVQNSSGYGKSSILFRNDELNNGEDIEVETNGGSFDGNNSLRINPIQPLLLAYANKEGFVDYTKGWFDNISINGTGAILRFEPYFFSAPVSIKNDLDVSLFVDGNKIDTIKPNEISVTSNSGTEGEMRAEIFTKEYSLQNLKTVFSIIFN